MLRVDAVVREHVVNLLLAYDYNLRKVSITLGIDRRTLYRWLQRWKIDPAIERRNIQKSA